MSDLIAVAYPDRATAETVRDELAVTPDKVIPRISQYGGEILQTSLSNESEQQLQEALNAAAHA